VEEGVMILVIVIVIGLVMKVLGVIELLLKREEKVIRVFGYKS
jgi:hypothetical protein